MYGSDMDRAHMTWSLAVGAQTRRSRPATEAEAHVRQP
ncbi:hypothetical protein TRIHO_00020 [Tritonibacter horizontis]|uniref:Uncharacterized protein n=1 Tax=Tritonibacter horizontis TaxID=1768241 RepID=A0A132C3E0_9RHOB|nr:hypothetical protein TRIHO_00020 [Tritonibacter horizontis]